MILKLTLHAYSASRRRKCGIVFRAVVILCLALVRCGSLPTAGGGSDLPNGAVAQVYGYVGAPDSTPLADAVVFLRAYCVGATGDSIVLERQTRSSIDGWFGFDSVAPGAYAIFCQSLNGNLAAVNQFIRAFEGRDTVIGPISLIAGLRVNLVGNVLLPPALNFQNVEIFIPGTGIGVSIKTSFERRIRYLLSKVPAGRFDLAIVYGNVSNYLQVEVHPANMGQDLNMRDITFAPLGVMADTALETHPATTERSYYITPQAYEEGLEPPWCWGLNYAGVDYFEYQGGVTIRWDPQALHSPPAFDTLMAGVAWREPSGRVMLETFGDRNWIENKIERWELKGNKVDLIDEQRRFVLVAVIRRSESTFKWLDVVDMETYPQCEK